MFEILENTVKFSDLKAGTTFMCNNSKYMKINHRKDVLYIKYEDGTANESYPNAVCLENPTGLLPFAAYFLPNHEVIPERIAVTFEKLPTNTAFLFNNHCYIKIGMHQALILTQEEIDIDNIIYFNNVCAVFPVKIKITTKDINND